MKRLLALAFAGVFSCGLHAQAVDATVCDILNNPQSFNGKIVRIKGTVSAGFDHFMVKGEDCKQKVDGIWLAYPEGTKAKSGPMATVQIQAASNFTGTAPTVQQTPVALDKKDKGFKDFDSLLSTPYKSKGMCLGCMKFEVSATLVGRLDGVESASLQRDKAGKIVSIGGFGNLNAYKARLVLQSVADVTSKEIDYSKVAAASKGEGEAAAPGPGGPGGGPGGAPSVSDPYTGLRTTAKGFGPGTEQGAQLERDAAAFGNQKDKSNTVAVSFNNTAEAPAKLDGKGSMESPDGLLFICKFNNSRLSGDSMERAVAHIGGHIADVRTPVAGFEAAGPFELEYRGWVQSVLDSVPGNQKTLSLPGDFVLWDTAVPLQDRNNSLNAALLDFLSKEALLNR
jgi:hypothetical protein